MITTFEKYKIKLSQEISDKLSKEKESGMGYQKVNVLLKNGKIIKNQTVTNSKYLLSNTNIKTKNIDKIFLNESENQFEFIAYHSTDSDITDFNFNDIELKAGSSTRIDGLFFSNIPQSSWGENIYKVKIISKNPAIFDLSKSRFDSLGIQEAFDALLRQDSSYIIEDLVEYGGMGQDDAEKLVDKWNNLDLIVIKNQVYAKHDIEYIIPDSYYNGNSAKIIILENLNNKKESILEKKDNAKYFKIALKLQSKLNFKELKYLASGNHGSAYAIGDNKVLKITDDKKEFEESTKIKDLENLHIADVYNTFNYDNLYVIIREYLLDGDDIPQMENKIHVWWNESKMYKKYGYLAEFIFDYHYGHYTDKDVFELKNIMEKSKLSSNVKNYFFEFLEMIKEIKNLGLTSVDYDVYNLGYKQNGNLAYLELSGEIK